MVTCEGGLWITAMGRVVLDDHNNEAFFEPSDTPIMTAEELTNGVSLVDFQTRMVRTLLDRENKKREKQE